MNIFIIIWIIWCTSEVLLNRLIRSGSTDKKNQDKGSLVFIWVMITIAITLGVVFANFIDTKISTQLLIPYIGLATIVLGIVLRFVSIYTLGKFFTVDVTIRHNHEIKKDGFYKIVRHPSYSGALLSFLGFGVSLNNWLSLLVIVVLVGSAFLYRIKIEEKALINHFGTDYLDYKKHTYRLIPWVY
nr:isoprenylcysteine carboxylmethyltransferase family protein [uncultured Carboxylicivirga sp.]